ncbi:nuclear receptor-binding factor 2 [Halyomorpha halys]|uniref:nuclear receptor-binding factor 2 n=1 Tax=Halyomorpha halys TaxID=286706 RepID=UPI0006D513C3|nr:nuclear receptor-binding factor 2 [Halyomorpha halys]
MDNKSPLYLAHLNARNAEKFSKKKAFEEAIECHLNASALLQEAMTLTTFAKTLESLQLQKNYHLAQTEIIRAQQIQFALRKKLAELRKRKKMEKRKVPEGEQKNKELEWAVLRKMEEADSLITQLGEKQDEREINLEDISREAKFDKTVIEELKVVNSELRSIITKLLNELESSRMETESLKSRLKLYEGGSLPDLAPLELPTFDFSCL